MIEASYYNILISPHVSEKVASPSGENKLYAFKVVCDSDKSQIKRAVEQIFNVKVKTVRVCHVKGKLKKHGRSEGRRKSWKKAYVTLQTGQEISEEMFRNS